MRAPEFEFDYLTRQPEGRLAPLVASIWYARGTVSYTRERIAPTGSTVAVFVLGDPILHTADDGAGPTLRADRGFLTGPHDRPAVNEPTGETFAVGVVTTPVGCQPLFGLPPSTLRGRVVDLCQAWPAAATLRNRLLAAPEPAAMLDLVEHHLDEHCDDAVGGLARVTAAVALLEDDPVRPIAEVAAELDLSHGHLNTEFTRLVGLTPRALARLLRMRALLARLDIEAEPSWTDEAARLGWFDQAHMIRDFKRHTGVTPTEYLAARRAVYGADQGAPGFVPEIPEI